MGRKTTRLLVSFLLITMVGILPSCSLPARADPKIVSEQTANSLLFTQSAGTPSITPPLPISPTPSPTLTVTPPIPPIFFSPTPPARPLTYTLQAGEYPWCIARRFDVDPGELLRVNNLGSGMIYSTGLTLTIPQLAGPFPPPRSLNPHPATFIVPRSNMTVNAVACHFGDVDPLAIMQANGLTSYFLSLGQSLKIP